MIRVGCDDFEFGVVAVRLPRTSTEVLRELGAGVGEALKDLRDCGIIWHEEESPVTRYLIELISRMTAKEDRCLNSDDSVAWHAHREVETLSDPSIVDELAEYLRTEKDRKRRTAAYFILGKLGRKVRTADCASILLLRLSNEHDKYVLSSLLDSLSWITKPRSLDLGPIYDLLHDDRWVVRSSAIDSLRLTEAPGAEDQVIDLLVTTTNPQDIVYCHATLNKIGSAKSLPYLEKNLDSRKRDVKLSAQLAIEAIKSRIKLIGTL